MPSVLQASERDSLWKSFQDQKEPANILKVANKLLSTVDDYKDSLIKPTHESVYKNLPAISFQDDEFEALRNYIYILTSIGDYENAEQTVNWTINNLKNVKQKNFESRLYMAKARLFDYKGERKSVFELYEEALSRMTSKEPGLVARIEAEIGRLHYDLGDYKSAMKRYVNALDYYEEENIHDYNYVNLLHFIGSVFKRQNQDDKAMEYYEKMMAVAQKNDNKAQEAEALYLLADLYAYAGDYEKDRAYLLRSLAIYRDLNDDMGVAQIQMNLAHGEIYAKEYKSALDRLNEVEAISKKANNSVYDYTLHRYYGRIYAALGDHEKSMYHFNKTLEIIKNSEVKQALNYSRVYRNLAFVMYDKGDFQKAFDYLDLHLLYKDTVISEENQQIVQELEQKYENKKKENEILSLNKDKEIKAKEIERKNTLITAFIAGSILLLLLVGIIYYSLLQNKSKNKIITQQKHEVEEKNREIMDSITYAKRIQNAILPPKQLVKQYLASSFILYKPKDIVAGDFYWMEPSEDTVIFAVADCTGHGVPGAMVSVVCNNGLNRSVREFGLSDPGKILDKTRELVIQEFEKSDEDVKDGMDISLVSLTYSGTDHSPILKWAGANNPLWIIRKDSTEIEEFKADKQAIGKTDDPQPFTTHTISIAKGDSIFLFSDGYVDQFGGERNKKFKSSKLRELLLTIQDLPMDQQREILDETIESWKGEHEQIDDICMIGLRI